jgi:hypothetical protein
VSGLTQSTPLCIASLGLSGEYLNHMNRM